MEAALEQMYLGLPLWRARAPNGSATSANRPRPAPDGAGPDWRPDGARRGRRWPDRGRDRPDRRAADHHPMAHRHQAAE